MSKNIWWTEAEVAKVLEMRAEGRSVEEIAARIGRTPKGVKSKCVRSGLRAPNKLTARLQLRRALWSDDKYHDRPVWHPARDPKPEWLRLGRSA